ncbi:MAG: T9SS type A sorting domain-containing protein [candidate division Zixibacteria bacterium]|nr:T9SS type A sorting domain-containing protein [candidate division Zixibacteria bacterium]
MKKYKLFSFLFIFTAFLFLATPVLAQISDTVGVVDTCRVGVITTYPGSEVSLPIYAFNDEPLGAMVIPLKYSSSDLVCDSVSFVGTRLSSASYKGAEIDSLNKTIKIYAVSFSQIDPGNSAVAYVFFKVNENAIPQVIELDTFSTADPLVYLDFTYTWAVDMMPVFVKGAITIEEINLPPQIQSIADQYVNEGEALSINIYADDPEGDTVIFSVLNSPEGATFVDSGNGKAVFLWTPPYTGAWSSENSPYTITFVASDGDTSSAEDVLINVIDKIPDSQDYTLEIGADTGIYLDTVIVPLKLINPDSIEAMNLLVHYDRTSLYLRNVSKLNTRLENWEYFQYRINQPLLGDISILALADIPDPTIIPPLPPGEGVVVNLIFQIILDPCPLDLSTQVKFKFIDSTSNTFSATPGHNFIGQTQIEYHEGYILIDCPNDVNEEKDGSDLPESFELFQNFPNPFNPKTDINFTLPRESDVRLVIYNIKGQIVNNLVDKRLEAGRYKVVWEGDDFSGNKVASGIYFYRIEAGSFRETKKMIMMK